MAYHKENHIDNFDKFQVQNDGSQLPGSDAVWLSSSGPHIANATSVAVAPVARSLSNRYG